MSKVFNAIHAHIAALDDNALASLASSESAQLALLRKVMAAANSQDIEEAWNQISTDAREQLLRSVISGPEAKVSAFALATKKFSELPDYVRAYLGRIKKQP